MSDERLYYDDGWETSEKIGPLRAIENAIEDYEFLLESGPPGFSEDWDDNRRGMIRGLREAARRLRKRSDVVDVDDVVELHVGDDALRLSLVDAYEGEGYAATVRIVRGTEGSPDEGLRVRLGASFPPDPDRVRTEPDNEIIIRARLEPTDE